MDCSCCASSCCSCGNDDEEAPERLPPASDAPLTPTRWLDDKPRRLEHPRRFVGIEIELASYRATPALAYACRTWSVHRVHDASLPTTGCELVTAPARGAALAEMVRALCAAVEESDGNVNASCGLHVHVDARDLRHHDMRRVLMLYLSVQDALYAMQPPSRRAAGSMCAPLNPATWDPRAWPASPSGSRDKMLASMYGEKKQARYSRREKYASIRYHGINVHSWLYRGTLEFRMHSGTTQAEKILPWATLCAALVCRAVSARERDIPRSGQPLSDQVALLLDIAPTTAVKDYVTQRIARFAGNETDGGD